MILALFAWARVSISLFGMLLLCCVELVIYFVFIRTVLQTVSQALHIRVFAVKFSSEFSVCSESVFLFQLYLFTHGHSNIGTTNNRNLLAFCSEKRAQIGHFLL